VVDAACLPSAAKIAIGLLKNEKTGQVAGRFLLVGVPLSALTQVL
jgi:hypothetical protein